MIIAFILKLWQLKSSIASIISWNFTTQWSEWWMNRYGRINRKLFVDVHRAIPLSHFDFIKFKCDHPWAIICWIGRNRRYRPVVSKDQIQYKSCNINKMKNRSSIPAHKSIFAYDRKRPPKTNFYEVRILTLFFLKEINKRTLNRE